MESYITTMGHVTLLIAWFSGSSWTLLGALVVLIFLSDWYEQEVKQ